jgi:hypothetical protein
VKHYFVKTNGRGKHCLGCGFSQMYARATCDGRLYPSALAQIDQRVAELEEKRRQILEAQRAPDDPGPPLGFKTRKEPL